jgi:hypothetical protein
MKTSSIDEVVTQLTSIPKSLKEAAGVGGLPREPGLYAWWTVPGSIPNVPHCPHPTLPDLDLFYVGISPSSAKSSRTCARALRATTSKATPVARRSD